MAEVDVARIVNFDEAGPQTRLLETKRKLYESTVALENAKSTYNLRAKELEDRESSFRARDEVFHKQMLDTTTLLNENKSKAARSEKRGVEERRTMHQKEIEIAESEAVLESAKELFDGVDSAKEKLQKYSDYLTDFQSRHATTFPDVGSILDRHAILESAQADLMREAERLQDLVEKQRMQLSKAAKAQQTATLNAENVLTSLRERIESARAEVVALQASADGAVARHAYRTLELGQLLQSASNIHGRCLASERGRVIKHSAKDAKPMGYAIPDFSAQLGLPPLPLDSEEEEEDEEDAVSEQQQRQAEGQNTPGRSLRKRIVKGHTTTMDLVGPGMEGEEWLQPHISAAASMNQSMNQSSMTSTTHTTHGTPGRGTGSGPHNPVFLAVASPQKKHHGPYSPTQDGASHGPVGMGATGGPHRNTKPVDVTGMDPVMIRDKVTSAMGQLYTVAAFLKDYQAMLAEYGQWQQEQRKAEAEVAATAAAAAAEAAAQAEYQLRLKNGGKSPSKSSAGTGGGAGKGSLPSFTPIKAAGGSALGGTGNSHGSVGPSASAGHVTSPLRASALAVVGAQTFARGSSLQGRLGGVGAHGSSMASGSGASAWAGHSSSATAGAQAFTGSARAERVVSLLAKQGAKVYTVSPIVKLPPPTDAAQLAIVSPRGSAGDNTGRGGAGTEARMVRSSMIAGHGAGPGAAGMANSASTTGQSMSSNASKSRM